MLKMVYRDGECELRKFLGFFFFIDMINRCYILHLFIWFVKSPFSADWSVG